MNMRTLSDHLAKMPSLAIPLNADLSNHLPKMPELAKLVNADLSKGFTVSQVAEKHGWTEPMVWPIALKGKRVRIGDVFNY